MARRLARRAGVVRLSPRVYEQFRRYLRNFITEIMRDAVHYLESEKKPASFRTLTYTHMRLALKRHGIELY